MNKILTKESSTQVVMITAYLIAVTIVLPIKIHNAAIAIFAISVLLIISAIDINIRSCVRNPVFILVFIQFGIILLGLTHTINLSHGLKELERSFYPIVMLIVVILMKGNEVKLDNLFFAFAIGCFGIILFGITYAWTVFDFPEFIEIVSSGHSRFTSLFEIHQPLYLVVYFIAIFFFLMEVIRTRYSELTSKKKVTYIAGIVCAFTMIFFLRSKTGLLIFPALLFLYSVLILNKRGWLFAFLVFVLSLMIFLVDKNSVLKLIDQYGSTVSTAFDQRIFIWKGAIEGIKNSPLIGAGTGGAQELLNAGYKSIGYEEGVVNEFNAHNQYLQFMARNGLMELIIFLSILGYSFWRSSKESNYTFLMFNMLVAFVMITESFLSVQKGIVFFYFFTLAFIYLGNKKSEKAQVL